MAIPVFLAVVGYPLLLGLLCGLSVSGGCQGWTLSKRCRGDGVRRVGRRSGLGGLRADVHRLRQRAARDFTLPHRVLSAWRTGLTPIAIAVDMIAFAIASVGAARSFSKAPFCETCQRWYPTAATARLRGGEAPLLLGALSNPSIVPRALVPAAATDTPWIELLLQRCECAGAEALLTATWHWKDVKAKGKGTSDRSRDWFRTLIPAELGRSLGILSPCSRSRAMRRRPPRNGWQWRWASRRRCKPRRRRSPCRRPQHRRPPRWRPRRPRCACLRRRPSQAVR